MINIEQQQNLFTAIGRELKKKVTTYAIGGTAMMFHGFKETTLDVDLVFETEKDRKNFRNAVESLGYKEMNAFSIYGNKSNRPEMLTLGKERLDLFLNKVIRFVFSKNMQERALQTHQFGDKLFIKIANPHDLILMKCATDRIKDKDDVKSILEKTSINFDIIIQEAQYQIILGNETSAFDLGCFLEEMKKIVKNKIPDKVLDKLFEIVRKQAEKKQK